MIHLTFETRAMSRALSIIGTLTKKRTTLPILDNVLLRYDAEQAKFSLMGSDSEAWLELDVEGMTLIEGANDLQAICLPFDFLHNAISQLPAMPVQAWLDLEAHTMKVDYQTGSFSLPIVDAGEFPAAPVAVTKDAPGADPAIQPICAMTLPTSWLLGEMKAARVSVASDELRPVMNGECFDVTHEDVTIVSTNGTMLYKRMYHGGMGSGFLAYAGFGLGESRKLLLPRNGIDAVLAAFGKNEEIEIVADTRLLSFRSVGVILTCRSIEGNYPNYNSVIPATTAHQVTICRDTLIAVLKRLNIFADGSSNLITMERQDDQLVLQSANIEFSLSGLERVPIDGDTTLPGDLRFGFKASQLLGLLGNVRTDNVIIQLNEPNKAILLKEEDAQSTMTMLLMPMLVNA